MSEDLFSLPDTENKIYNHVKSSKWKQDIRDYINKLWANGKEFIPEKQFPKEFSNDLISRWWEIYLANVFIKKGYTLLPPIDHGPDFRLKSGDKIYNIEAIAPGPGEGEDACPTYPRGHAFSYSDVKLILRLTSAVREKRLKFEKYIEQDIVSKDDVNIIAVNLSKIDLSDEIYNEHDIPIIAKAFLGFDELKYKISVNFDHGESSDPTPHFDKREKLMKVSGADISLTSFLDNSCSSISGIFCSAESFVLMPELGNKIWFLHNPCAENRVAKGFFQFGTEWMPAISNTEVILEHKKHL